MFLFLAGHYLFMDSSFYTYGSWARLRSKLFSPTDHAELEFGYYMNGASVHALKVYVVVNGFKNLVSEITGDQGDRWHTEHVRIKSKFPYRVSTAFRVIIPRDKHIER